MGKRAFLFLSTILAGVDLASNAFAAAADQAPEPGGQVQQIVITAQRRTENLQKAAISAQALTPQALLNANVGTNPADLSRLVPAAQFISNASIYPQFTVRGVGNQVQNPYTDATVGVNYDGVPIVSVPSTVGMFYDLQRIEVLKGPQGTLYGHNNTGGSINVLPVHPVIGKYLGGITLIAGNFDTVDGTGYLNVPLGQTAAMRGSFNITHRDGYYNNGQGDDKGESGRLQVRFAPSDRLDINIGADYHHQGGQGPGTTLAATTGTVTAPDGVIYATTNDQPYGGTWHDLNTDCTSVKGSTPPLSLSDFGLSCLPPGHLDNQFYGIQGALNWRTDLGTLTIIPAARWQDLNSLLVGIPTTGNLEHAEATTLEARFASDPTKRFNYIVGTFYLNQVDNANFFIDQGPVLHVLQLMNQTAQSEALFATVRYSITPALRISAGVRYTWDHKTFNGQARFGPGYVLLSSQTDRGASWQEPTYRAGLEYDVAKDSMLYANYERGYKAGGFFFSSPVLGQTFNPEFVDAYTLGSKNLFFDHRLLLNIELFKYLYTNQQVSQQEPDPGSPLGLAVTTRNYGKVDIQGVEIESQFYLTNNTLLSADLQFLDARVKQAGKTTTTPLVTPAMIVGQEAPYSPPFTATFGVTQTFPLTSGGSIVANLSGQYRGGEWMGTDYLPFERVPGAATGDAYLQYNAQSRRWSVTVFVDNFTDAAVPNSIYGTGLYNSGPFTIPQPTDISYQAPRTYGVRVSANF